MRIEQIMARPAQYCRPGDSLARAAQLMWDHDCGCLPVVGGNGADHVVGMITDRDICMCAMFEGCPLQALRVEQAMAKQVQFCRPDTTLADAERMMRDARVRRLPVVDENEALLGVISLADIAQAAEHRGTARRREVTPLEVASTLAEISRPLHRELAA